MGHCSSCDRCKAKEEKQTLTSEFPDPFLHPLQFLNSECLPRYRVDPFLPDEFADDLVTNCKLDDGSCVRNTFACEVNSSKITELADILHLIPWELLDACAHPEEIVQLINHFMAQEPDPEPRRSDDAFDLALRQFVHQLRVLLHAGHGEDSTSQGITDACAALACRHSHRAWDAANAAEVLASPKVSHGVSSQQGKGQGRGLPPGKAPARCKAPSAVRLGPDALPRWSGPVPEPGWKSERLVNWQPVRALDRFEGSVWQRIHDGMRDGALPLSERILRFAFARADDCTQVRKNVKISGDAVARRLPGKQALSVDLLHANLSRAGIHSPSQLSWAIGVQREASELVVDSQEELSDDVLESVLCLLRLASGKEECLCEAPLEGRGGHDRASTKLAPAEAFLQELLRSLGPAIRLVPKLEMALDVARFDTEAANLEEQMRIGLSTVSKVLKSVALPSLLEGALLLGNYVNANNKALGGVVCVTLDSLPKLAHTRCVPSDASEGVGYQNALDLLVWHFQRKEPDFLDMLSSDLEECKKSGDLDQKVIADAIGGLEKRISSIAEVVRKNTNQVDEAYSRPEALSPDRLNKFLVKARPNLQALQLQFEELDKATCDLRKYFAEPASSNFTDMMQSLTALYEALPLRENNAASRAPATPGAGQLTTSAAAAAARPVVRRHTLLKGVMAFRRSAF